MAARHFEGAIHAAIYAQVRTYAPPRLTSKVIDYLKKKYLGDLTSALDVGCGSGQSTNSLSGYFKHVTGIDISQAQINEAIIGRKCDNITYKVGSAEKMPFEDQSFQLVTVGQACHWFDMPVFFKEVNRILEPNGVLALYGYNLPRPHYPGAGDQICQILDKIHDVDVKDYWGKERIFVNKSYTDKKFKIPFPDTIRKDISFEKVSSVRDLQGYVNSWSGFQKYKRVKGEIAGQKILDCLVNDVMDVIGDSSKTPENAELTLKFTFFLIMGRK